MSLTTSTYGKQNVKFLKVKKDPSDPLKHEIIEATVKVLLEGAFDKSYTAADNSSIVPTDTVKNTILILAKTTEVWPIEAFAVTLSSHFIKKYSHVTAVTVEIAQERWVKYDDKHSFIHQGPEKRKTNLYHTRKGDYKLSSSITDLTVLKSTGSQFHGYNVCDFTTLKPTTDRILSTDVSATWEFDSKTIGSIEKVKSTYINDFDKVYNLARDTTLKFFSTENSASVQATMFNTATDILANSSTIVGNVSYTLPNKHYFLIDLAWKGLENNNELFYPSPHPSGLIQCTVSRNSKSKL